MNDGFDFVFGGELVGEVVEDVMLLFGYNEVDVVVG